MIRFQNIFRFLTLPMVAVMIWASLGPGMAHAALVTTDQAIDGARSTAERARVIEFLSREDVQDQMKTLGVKPGEAMARVNSMSDAEIGKIAGRLETMPAGQDVLTAVVSAALILFLVLLVTDLLGFTSVFPFTNKGSARN